MSTSGPTESYFGDPTWATLVRVGGRGPAQGRPRRRPPLPEPPLRGHRRDRRRARSTPSRSTCGLLPADRRVVPLPQLRLPGGRRRRHGQDGARMPVGDIRTYAHLGDDGAPFTFDAWARAVRAGRTFTTSGPLARPRRRRAPARRRAAPAGRRRHAARRGAGRVGRPLPRPGGRGQRRRWSPPSAPAGGAFSCTLRAPIKVPGSAWIAARCTSTMSRWIGSPRTRRRPHVSGLRRRRRAPTCSVRRTPRTC